MEVITSSTNAHVKSLRALYTKKGRAAQDAYVVEGVNIVKDIPQSQPVSAYYFAASRADELAGVVKDAAARCYVLADDLFDRVADTVTPQGVVAVLPIPHSHVDLEQVDRLLVLDGVADPGNVGTILRTAIAAGITDVVALGGADVYSPKVVRASMGGIYRLRVHPREDRAWPYTHPVHILDMAGDDLFDYVPPRRYALVAGSEAAGVSPEMRRIAAKSLSIPMQGGIESLNVAVATAIALYQLQHNAQ